MSVAAPLSSRHSQRGEGRIGCFLSAVVIGVVGAAGYKALPVLMTNNEFKDAVRAIATTASVRPVEELRKEIRAKAVELKIPEAADPNAVQLTKSGDNLQGTITIRYNYSRKIDFYGAFSVDVVTHDTVSLPYMDAR